MSKLVFGVGVNDADYSVQKFEFIGGKWKRVWVCPFYERWKHVLARCYSEVFLKRRPTYLGCYTVPEWHSFMAFHAWMVEQDWEGKHLDKDILFPGNKVYGPDTCVFVDPKVNTFMLECTSSQGVFPVGVSYHKRIGKFQARCQDSRQGKRKNLGYFNSPDEAHSAWLEEKLRQAKMLASEQEDERVAKALIERYQTYNIAF